jgi:hypothetical protein
MDGMDDGDGDDDDEMEKASLGLGLRLVVLMERGNWLVSKLLLPLGKREGWWLPLACRV